MDLILRWVRVVSGAIALVAVGLLSGCVDQEDADIPASPTTPAEVDFRLRLNQHVLVDTAATHEPAVTQLPDGTLFVAGSCYSACDPPVDPNALWKSTDGGTTWAHVGVGSVGEGYLGNGDVDLAAGSDGTLYFATELRSPALSHVIGIGATTDAGSTWHWNILTARPHAVRPWVEVAPSGRAHVVWTSMDGMLVHHAVTDDRGRTWTETKNPSQTAAGSGLAVGPDGTVAVRVKPPPGLEWERYPSLDGIMVSSDSGQNWRYSKLPGTRDYFSGNPDRRADPITIDPGGTMYTAWGTEQALILADSADLGLTWNVNEVSNGSDTVWFPRLEAGAKPGELAITWYTKKPAGNFTANVAHTRDGGKTARNFSFYADVEATTVPPGPGGEYIQAVFPQGGGIATATKFSLAGPLEREGFAFRLFE